MALPMISGIATIRAAEQQQDHMKVSFQAG
jgi:hypothetical protein